MRSPPPSLPFRAGCFAERAFLLFCNERDEVSFLSFANGVGTVCRGGLEARLALLFHMHRPDASDELADESANVNHEHLACLWAGLSELFSVCWVQ
eukprot:m.37198 g.37198  ORF g.37198 m.37198 type:complete len:96 (-) comp5818_c0_seq4:96-383(-)